MPPKKKSKKKSAFKYFDDKNQELEPEAYFLFLEKKLKTLSKNEGVPPSNELLKSIKDVFGGEDKTKQGQPFTQVMFLRQSQPKQIVAGLKLLEKYQPIKTLTFIDTIIDLEVMKSLTQLMAFAKELKTVNFAATKISEDLINLFITTLPQSQVKSISFLHERFLNSSLDLLGATVEKYVQLAFQKAQAAIDESKAKHEEDLEKQAKLKKKKKKKKKKGVELWTKSVEEIYTDFFFLDNISLQFCKIEPLQAPNLGKLFEKVATFVSSVNLRGNEFGAVGLGEIGAGVERCALKAAERFQIEEKEIEKQIYAGTKAIKLKSLNLSACRIQENFDVCYKQFGNGVRKCGNLQQIDIGENPIPDKMMVLLNPSFILQTQLTKVVTPLEVDSNKLKELATQMKEHTKRQTQVGKMMKKLKKLEKKKGKKGKKEGEPADPQEEESKEDKEDKEDGDVDLGELPEDMDPDELMKKMNAQLQENAEKEKMLNAQEEQEEKEEAEQEKPVEEKPDEDKTGMEGEKEADGDGDDDGDDGGDDDDE